MRRTLSGRSTGSCALVTLAQTVGGWIGLRTRRDIPGEKAGDAPGRPVPLEEETHVR